MQHKVPRFHVQLDFGQLSDDDRHKMVIGIGSTAPKSDLFANTPAIQASVAALATKDADLTARNQTVVGYRVLLNNALSEEALSRSQLDGELHTLATLTEVGAKDPADIAAMAFKYRDPSRSTLPPEPPSYIDVEYPRRGHGKATVSAHQSDRMRRHYEAEMCLYGQDTWTRLVGNGKARTLRFPSGTQVWVRFATVRGEQQSDWCTPVLVMMP